MVFSLMAVGYAIHVFSLLLAWLNLWATKSKRGKQMMHRMVVRLLSGEFERCSKQSLKRWHDETAMFSQRLAPRFIIGIYYWNGTHPQGTTFLQKLWGWWDRIGQVGHLCKWLTILVDLPTGCNRRLLSYKQIFYFFKPLRRKYANTF